MAAFRVGTFPAMINEPRGKQLILRLSSRRCYDSRGICIRGSPRYPTLSTEQQRGEPSLARKARVVHVGNSLARGIYTREFNDSLLTSIVSSTRRLFSFLAVLLRSIGIVCSKVTVVLRRLRVKNFVILLFPIVAKHFIIALFSRIILT